LNLRGTKDCSDFPNLGPFLFWESPYELTTSSSGSRTNPWISIGTVRSKCVISHTTPCFLERLVECMTGIIISPLALGLFFSAHPRWPMGHLPNHHLVTVISSSCWSHKSIQPSRQHPYCTSLLLLYQASKLPNPTLKYLSPVLCFYEQEITTRHHGYDVLPQKE